MSNSVSEAKVDLNDVEIDESGRVIIQDEGLVALLRAAKEDLTKPQQVVLVH